MKKGAAFAISLLLAIGASAQGIEPQRIMVALTSDGLEDANTLRDSLEAAIAATPLARLVVRHEGPAEELGADASRSSCPIALQVDVAPSPQGLRASWRFIATSGNEELRSGSFEKALPAERDLVTSFWTEVEQDLAPSIAVLPRSYVVVSAPTGTRVEGFGSSFEMPASGEVEIPLSIPALISWKARSKAYLDASGKIFIDEPGTRFALPLMKSPSWTAELSLYGFSFLEARSSLLLGKRLFARLTLTQFSAGINLQNYSGPPPEPSLLSSYGLAQFGGGFGAYFEDPDKPLRFYAAVDAFARLDMPAFQAFFLDPVSPIGLSPLLGVEWGRTANVKLYFEVGGIFYPWTDVELMLASRGTMGGNLVVSGPGWFPGHPGWLAEFPVPRLGLRLYL